MKHLLFAATASLALAVAGGASAQSVKDIYSYKAPSGMFSEGSTKHDMYRFMAEDAERQAQLRAGDDVVTGSTRGGATSTESYPRPGESTTRRVRVR